MKRRRSIRNAARLCTLLAITGAFLVPARAAVADTNPTTPCTVADTDCPAAYDDAYTTPMATALVVPKNVGLLSNDHGIGSTHIDIDSSDTVSAFGNATITYDVDGLGGFTYTPDPEAPWTGVDTFSYWVLDNDGGSATADVTITIPAVLHNDSFTVHAGANVIPAPGAYANDVGIDPTLPDIDDTNVHGDVFLNDDGSIEYTPDAGFNGAASFDYGVYDIDDDIEYFATVTLNVDGIAPTKPSETGPSSALSLSTKLTPAWSASTDAHGIKNYDAQVRSAPWNAAFGSYANIVSAKNVRSASFTGTAGRTYCFRSRARDVPGNVSAWSNEKCSAIPLKASSLTYSSGWSHQSRTDVYGGVVYSSKTKNAKVTRASAKAKNIYLVVTKCPTCGTIQVRWNNVVKGTYNLFASSTLRKQVIHLPALASVQSGTLTITVTSPNGKTVAIEGAAFSPV